MLRALQPRPRGARDVEKSHSHRPWASSSRNEAPIPNSLCPPPPHMVEATALPPPAIPETRSSSRATRRHMGATFEQAAFGGCWLCPCPYASIYSVPSHSSESVSDIDVVVLRSINQDKSWHFVGEKSLSSKGGCSDPKTVEMMIK
ncbi:hypothetical protein LX36DRAFT_259932 [Colletotrichum falcatum]|nr:hypothetical protein LX36DRAFT_259932 [Colletotrichum falcatum]